VSVPVAQAAGQSWTTGAAAIRGIAGLCLEADSASSSGGESVALWPCVRARTLQQFDFGPDQSIETTASNDGGPPQCLAVTGDGTVTALPCDGSDGQRWTLGATGSLREGAGAGRCLEAVTNATDVEAGLSAGLALHVAACSGDVTQQFDILGRLLVSEMCLDVYAYERADQTVIETWTCGGSGTLPGNENQWWDVTW